jgi:hypothetical protein
MFSCANLRTLSLNWQRAGQELGRSGNGQGAMAVGPAEWKSEESERVTHLLLRVVEEEGGRGEEPRRPAAGRGAAEERREPPLHLRVGAGLVWSGS